MTAAAKAKRHYIILVEDNEQVCRTATAFLKKYVPEEKIICVHNLKRALELFRAHGPEIDTILVDGELGEGSTCDTLPLAKEIDQHRKHGLFSGLAIAMSSRQEVNDQLVQAGCDYAAASKLEAIKAVCAMLAHPHPTH